MGLRALVVDDEAVQRESLRRGLRREGIRVVEAGDGLQALHCLQSEEGRAVDLVLTDYSMPGMSGLDFVRELRRRRPLLPVIMMTAYGDKALVIDAMREGCTLFLEKPFTLVQLMTEVNRAGEGLVRQRELDGLSRRIPLLAHQINNPLAAIVGFAEMALLNLDDRGALISRLSKILDASEKILDINRSIMGIGRGEEGDSSADPAGSPVGPRPEPEGATGQSAFDLRDLVDECVATFEDVFRRHAIRVEREGDSDSLRMCGNRSGLGQVFKNLLLNAVEAMRGEDRRVLTVAVACAAGPDRVAVRIADTGRGIPDDVLPRLFTPRFTTKLGGNGFGLAVAREIVAEHGGRVVLRGLPERGVEAVVELPARPPGPGASAPPGQGWSTMSSTEEVHP